MNRMKRIRKMMDRLVAKPGKKISLKDYDSKWTGNIKDKKEATVLLEDGVKELAKHQDKLYAQDTYSLLMVFQAMDAAGKDGTIRHVMSGVNPQGCQVFSFKAPSAEERDHDYLWRTQRRCRSAGASASTTGPTTRKCSWPASIPRSWRRSSCRQDCKKNGVWKRRFEEINHFEQYLVDNGIVVLKFFLHVSKKEQKRRFLERIDLDDKNWKFSVNDAKERTFWKDYMHAYEDVFTHTSTKRRPGTSSRRTTSGSCAWPSRRSRIRPSTI